MASLQNAMNKKTIILINKDAINSPRFQIAKNIRCWHLPSNSTSPGSLGLKNGITSTSVSSLSTNLQRQTRMGYQGKAWRPKMHPKRRGFGGTKHVSARMFQQVFGRHLHAWNDESQVKWQGMHGTLPPKKNAFHRWLPNQVPNEDCDRTKEQLQEQNAQEKVPHLHISDMQWRHKDRRCE